MSRIPPSLLYLTIYNPNIQPSNHELDDEDAEEQAQILFYTGSDRAVSRDRILRQVGLAKALVNFSSMFNPHASCENTHSQSRRMIMVSPEPGFWIHACIELAKTPRPPKSNVRGKGKGKEKEKEREKSKDPVRQAVHYEYHDGSLHDAALREDILQAYEQFRLTHGSFSCILAALGQQALELQLERFFTVWAWSWNLVEKAEFGKHLGLPLHPSYRKLAPLLDQFTSEHFSQHETFVLIPPHVIPSKKYQDSGYPSVLLKHTLAIIPPSSLPLEINEESQPADEGEKSEVTSETQGTEKVPQDNGKPSSNPFLAMDPRNLKWMWSGLAFGRNVATRSPSAVPSTTVSPSVTPGQTPLPLDSPSLTQVDVDTESLQDAMTSEDIHLSAAPSPASRSPVSPVPHSLVEDRTREGHEPAEAEASDYANEGGTSLKHDGAIPDSDGSKDIESAQKPAPIILHTHVYLAMPDTPDQTSRRKLVHATWKQFTFAVILDEEDNTTTDSVKDHVPQLFLALSQASEGVIRDIDAESTSTLTNILVPQNSYILSDGPFTSSSDAFVSTSDQFFNSTAILHSNFDVVEVFSRGQNPQHWHIGRHGTSQEFENISGRCEVYMEVARKESTLTDVDNELNTVMKSSR